MAQAVAAPGTGSLPMPVVADDTDPQDCSKNHFILDEPVDCWQKTGALHVGRLSHTATLLLDGRVLVAGGQGEAGTSAEIYDPSTRHWTLAAPLPISRVMHTATRLTDGRVLLLGGHETRVPGPPPDYVTTFGSSWSTVIDDTGDLYDPASDTWTTIPGPLASRDYFSATLLADGRVLVAGGLDASDDALGSCELYDPVSGDWTMTGSFTTSGSPPARYAPLAFWHRWGHTATLLNDGRVLVAAGFVDDFVMEQAPQAQLYDPATGAWTLAGEISDTRGWHTATLLADGRVMVAGGEWHHCNGGCGERTLASTEIYDARTNAWSAGPPLVTPHSFHTATLLPDGSLLVAGGSLDVSGIPDFAAIAIGDTEASPAPAAPWMPAAHLGVARWGHTATLLRDGSVLVVGGKADESYDSPALRSAEIYLPRGSTP
jgi:hypothetical protein